MQQFKRHQEYAEDCTSGTSTRVIRHKNYDSRKRGQRQHSSHEIKQNIDVMGARWITGECSGLPKEKKQKEKSLDDGPCAAETCHKLEKKYM
jgi:hypothetical protein